MTKRTYTVDNTTTNDDPEFEIVGKQRDGSAIDPVSFKCLPMVQGVALTDIVAASRGNAIYTLPEINAFIHKCLLPEEEERYDALVNGKDVIVDIEILGRIMEDLAGDYASRPFGQSSNSQPGPLPMPDTSTGTSTQPESATSGTFQ